MRTKLIIKDQTTGNIAHTPIDELADVLTEWFPEAHANVREATTELVDAVNAGHWKTRVPELAAFLSITIEKDTSDDATDVERLRVEVAALRKQVNHLENGWHIKAAVNKLNALDGTDPEADHVTADSILMTVVPDSVRDAYRSAQDRSEMGWWYA